MGGGHCGEREKRRRRKRRLLQILTDTVVGGEDTVTLEMMDGGRERWGAVVGL